MVKIIERMTDPVQCGYLPSQARQLSVSTTPVSTSELTALVEQGWFYNMSFLSRPKCALCSACAPLRIKLAEFRPNRSQRRVERDNADTKLKIRHPSIDEARCQLYMKHHAQRSLDKGWDAATREDALKWMGQMVAGIGRCSEWEFKRGDRLVGILYTADLVNSYLGIYFYYDPDFAELSLGTWMILSVIKIAQARGHSYLYMGDFTAQCGSLKYKENFRPNQILGRDGKWHDFKGNSGE